MANQGTPAFFEQQLNSAQTAVNSGDFKRAFNLFSELQILAPTRGDIYFYFGCALLTVEEFDAAIQQLSKACQLLPAQHEPLFRLADAFEAVNSFSDVETVISFALKQFPKHPEVIYRAANFYKEIGQLNKADNLAAACIVHSHDMLLSSYAWLLRLNLSQLQDVAPALDALREINDKIPELANNASNKKKLQMITNYALGRFFELEKNTNEAFKHWQIANQLQLSMCDYEVKDLIPLFEAIKTNSTTLAAGSNRTTSFTPIFILGLPRTGSTLLEQTLCRHSDVSSLGEQAIIANQVVKLIAHHTQQPYPLFMQELNSEKRRALCQEAATLYENAVKKRQLNTPFVIDKLPANFQSIGLIKTVFPHAKIIHLSRNFADTALSIFKNHFAANEPYLCDLGELSAYHKLYKNLMQHWRQIDENEIFEITYENLVTAPELSIEKVLTFCGLSHQQLVRYTEKDKQPVANMVKTLSSVQVTEPLHQRAIGQHISYAAYLQKNGLETD